MYRLIPAVITVLLAFTVASPVVADEVEVDAIIGTLDCVADGGDTYINDDAFARDCHATSLETLAYIAPDVSTGCASLWEVVFTYHAIAYAGFDFLSDNALSVVDPMALIPNAKTATLACYGS